MTVTIEFDPDELARLAAVARREGVEVEELARRLVLDHLPSSVENGEEDPTLALFSQWDEEDARMTPAEVEEARREFEAFKEGINTERARAGARLIYP
jgi:hypothetical protein